MASNADNSYQANLSCVNDQVCISLDHNIKVHFKLDDSIMVKDYSRNSCISVAGTKVLPITTRLFSIHRDGVKVHHNSSDTLMIEFINEYDQAINNQ